MPRITKLEDNIRARTYPKEYYQEQIDNMKQELLNSKEKNKAALLEAADAAESVVNVLYKRFKKRVSKKKSG
ncbi:hypothetical protein D5018_10495 [Parashewanella curva]|uniref:Uncharacterized protein n=1 Tax=Parashewanella curva TaxID=2338552 RepID=A0A3L8PY96_9GAMM|nr:hypothetical protein [Parashewanella curva]RLV59789.1 hypothetical protein D5018_10495 [Parashewanella curva]